MGLEEYMGCASAQESKASLMLSRRLFFAGDSTSGLIVAHEDF
jgi:hypothetical protein